MCFKIFCLPKLKYIILLKLIFFKTRISRVYNVSSTKNLIVVENLEKHVMKSKNKPEKSLVTFKKNNLSFSEL